MAGGVKGITGMGLPTVAIALLPILLPTGLAASLLVTTTVGVYCGAVVVAIMHVIPRKGGHDEHAPVAKDPMTGAEVPTDDVH